MTWAHVTFDRASAQRSRALTASLHRELKSISIHMEMKSISIHMEMSVCQNTFILNVSLHRELKSISMQNSQVEVGQWSGGSFDISDLFGDKYTRAKKAMKVSAMPIRYTSRLRPMRLARIMAQQTEAWRTMLAAARGDVHRLPGDQTVYGKSTLGMLVEC